MKLSRSLRSVAFVAIAAAGVGGWLFLSGNGPHNAAEVDCRQRITAATGHEFSAEEVSAMSVTGDIRNGIVQGAFIQGTKLRYAVCEYAAGATKRVAIDGSALR